MCIWLSSGRKQLYLPSFTPPPRRHQHHLILPRPETSFPFIQTPDHPSLPPCSGLGHQLPTGTAAELGRPAALRPCFSASGHRPCRPPLHRRFRHRYRKDRMVMAPGEMGGNNQRYGRVMHSVQIKMSRSLSYVIDVKYCNFIV